MPNFSSKRRNSAGDERRRAADHEADRVRLGLVGARRVQQRGEHRGHGARRSRARTPPRSPRTWRPRSAPTSRSDRRSAAGPSWSPPGRSRGTAAAPCPARRRARPAAARRACHVSARKLACVSIAPFGLPVVPEVYTSAARSSGLDGAPARSTLPSPRSDASGSPVSFVTAISCRSAGSSSAVGLERRGRLLVADHRGGARVTQDRAASRPVRSGLTGLKVAPSQRIAHQTSRYSGPLRRTTPTTSPRVTPAARSPPATSATRPANSP